MPNVIDPIGEPINKAEIRREISATERRLLVQTAVLMGHYVVEKHAEYCQEEFETHEWANPAKVTAQMRRLLVDLMHFSERYRCDFNGALAEAMRAYQQERK